MFKTVQATAVALLLVAGPAVAKDVNRLATVVTDENPQTQLMGMILTLRAVERGVSARILLCGPAGDIALKDAPESATAGQPPRDMSPQGLLKAAMAKGVKVEVCAIYLPGKGAGEDALIDGVTVASPEAMAGALSQSQTRVWSF